MKKRLFALIMVFVLIVSLAACGQSSTDSASDDAADAKQKVERCVIGSSTQGGLYYLFAGGLAQEITANSERFEVTSESTAGSAANIKLIQSGDIDFGLSLGSTLYTGMNGTAVWADGQSFDKVTGAIPLYPGVLTIYTTNPEIKTIYDLDGKVVGLGNAGGGVDGLGRKIFEILGIEPAEIFNDTHSNTVNSVKDRAVDAAFVVQLAPWPGLQDLEATTDVSFVGLSDETIDKILIEFPYLSKMSIPGGVYKGAPEPVASVCDWTMLIIGTEKSDDFVYDLIKAVYESKEGMVSIHKSAASYLEPKNAVFSPVSLHPGAEKYLKEIGAEVPAK